MVVLLPQKRPVTVPPFLPSLHLQAADTHVTQGVPTHMGNGAQILGQGQHVRGIQHHLEDTAAVGTPLAFVFGNEAPVFSRRLAMRNGPDAKEPHHVVDTHQVHELRRLP